MSDTLDFTLKDDPTPPVLARMVMSFWVSKAIYAAAKLGVADLLEDGPQSVDELASATGAHGPSLYRLLRALTTVGVFRELPERRFGLSPLAIYLRTGAMRAFATMLGQEPYQAWGDLLYSVKTGKPAFEKMFGAGLFEYLSRGEETAAIFREATLGSAAFTHSLVAKTYDFSGVKSVCDVGGGQGSLPVSLLGTYPEMRCVLFDLPEVVAQGRKTVEEAGLASRCEFVAGDFFETVPGGCDMYVLSQVIHDWDDEHAVRILRNCRKVLPAHGRILVTEMIVPDHLEPATSKLIDLNMLVLTPGRERTQAEFRAIFEQSGLRLARVMETHSPAGTCILEGEAAEASGRPAKRGGG